MEKIMKLVSVSPMMQTEISRRDGSKKMIYFNELTLSDGVDTIHGETSETLTSQINATDPNLKLQLVQGALYMVRFNINSTEYEKDGKKNYFVRINIHQMYKMA